MQERIKAPAREELSPIERHRQYVVQNPLYRKRIPAHDQESLSSKCISKCIALFCLNRYNNNLVLPPKKN